MTGFPASTDDIQIKVDYTNTISKPLCTLLAVLLFSTMVNADSQSPTSKAIEQTAAKMDNFSAANDYSSRAGLFAVDGTFANVMQPEPVIGRDAIVELTKSWPPAETAIEGRVILGERMVIGWRERRHIENDKMSGCYRGISTFVFNAKGDIKEYEGVFNPMSIKAAMQQGQ